MEFLTLKHPTDGVHQIAICVTHDGQARVAIDGAEMLAPKIGSSIDWGNGVKTPNVVLSYWKDTGDMRVSLFDGWLCEGLNYVALGKLKREAPPEPVFAKLGEMGAHEDHAPTGTDSAGTPPLVTDPVADAVSE